MALIFCSMQVKNRPFLLSPAAKDYIWGGTRLREEYNKHIDVTPLAETWECSTHPDGPSRVASGAFAGEKLVDVLRAHPEFIGTHPKTDGEGGLPVLIKFIDAARDLSVQVHPSDEYARTHEHGQLGKTEMWYVLEAAPGASLVYGFRQDLTRAMLAASLEDDTVEQYLQKVEIHRGDVFLIESGTVHAIGAGAMIVARTLLTGCMTIIGSGRTENHGSCTSRRRWTSWISGRSRCRSSCSASVKNTTATAWSSSSSASTSGRSDFALRRCSLEVSRGRSDQ